MISIDAMGINTIRNIKETAIIAKRKRMPNNNVNIKNLLRNA